MSDKPTAQQVRDAIGVISALKLSGAGDWVMKRLTNAAERLEHEQDRVDKRDMRITELAAELRELYSSPGFSWCCVAEKLIDRYPFLLDESTR